MTNTSATTPPTPNLPLGDYVSPGLEVVRPDAAFPHLTVGDTSLCGWQYLRSEVPHNWYVDARAPSIGFVSRDEASILYNSARQFAGRRALEIGCWLGWSACHLALARVLLDVIDPLLARDDFRTSVATSLHAAGVLQDVAMWGGFSPDGVAELSARHAGRRWSLMFIDGNHDAPGPTLDAAACEPLAEPDALVLFHDLAAPDVADGLEHFRRSGWQTMIYQTMQIMGVAWRGTATPVRHTPDPSVAWDLPAHLRHLRVSQ